MRDKLIVILPAYNEEGNVNEMVSDWLKQLDVLSERFDTEGSILLVDDGSSDDTAAIAAELAREEQRFSYIKHERNQGLGAAVQTGFTYIMKNYSDVSYICIMDCDNTQPPRFIESMIEKQRSSGADIVIASRYQKGADIKGLTFHRELASIGAKYVYRFCFGIKGVQDYTCGYRLYVAEIIRKIFTAYDGVIAKEKGFTCMAEILYRASVCGAVFAEVPFELRYDLKNGASKMHVFKTIINSFKLISNIKKETRISGAVSVNQTMHNEK